MAVFLYQVFKKCLTTQNDLFSGVLALTGHVIPGDVYAWIAVVVLPINSALNPFLYTFSAIFGKKVSY